MTQTKKISKTAPSSVCRVNKNSNFTVMSNYHLRSMNLSLKAIGLLCKVLSLPEEWDYSISGLTSICREKETAIKAALKELKQWGYLKVTKLMPNETISGRIEYVYDFFEYSEKDKPGAVLDSDDTNNDGEVSTSKISSVKKVHQGAGKQDIDNLPVEILPIEIQEVENQEQLKTKEEINKNRILSDKVSINQSSADRQMDGYMHKKQIYTEIIKDNIGFDELADWLSNETDDGYGEAENIVDSIVRAICSTKPYDRICGQDFPREVIKSAMLKLDIVCVENAIEQMRENPEYVRNTEKYLISTLFNEANNRYFKANAENRWVNTAFKRDFG